MSLIVNYLCDEVKTDAKALFKLLVSGTKWFWKRFLKKFLYELLIAILIELLKKVANFR